jgi:hypothetical protein
MTNPEKNIIETQTFDPRLKDVKLVVPNNATPLKVYKLNGVFHISYLYKQNLIIITKTVTMKLVNDNEEFFVNGYYYLNSLEHIDSVSHCFVSESFMLGESYGK